MRLIYGSTHLDVAGGAKLDATLDDFAVGGALQFCVMVVQWREAKHAARRRARRLRRRARPGYGRRRGSRLGVFQRSARLLALLI